LLLVLVLSHHPEEKFGENGIFANDCCGTIKLADGKMLLNDTQNVRYTVETDAKGPYILPETFVGIVRDQGFEVDGTRSTRKLRLDRLPLPTRIELYEGVGVTPYVFGRRLSPEEERQLSGSQ
jgi:hypothetical protein